MMKTILRTLLANIVDYAGLFPPAALDMGQTVANYDRYRRGGTSWMLGRFVVTAARLDEFESTASPAVGADGGTPWLISALLAGDVAGDAKRVLDFNRRHAGAGRFHIDAVEVKAASAGAIDELAGMLPQELTAYVEIPIDGDPASLVETIARRGLRAKVRTGGAEAGMIPSSADLVRFIMACKRHAVPFKATAGLHHPMRAAYRLTSHEGSPAATMYGFLNVFLTAAFVHGGMKPDLVGAVVEEVSPRAFHFEKDSVRWMAHALDSAQIREARERLAISFGSCSFEEPVDDLKGMGLL